MSDPKTPNIGLWLPVPGERTWDVEVNDNWDTIDTAIGQLISGSTNWHYRNAWLPATMYVTNNVVLYHNTAYIALASFTSGATFGTGVGESWGVVAQGVFMRGAWSNVVAYDVNDIVTESGTSYICVVANTGNDPSTDGGIHWQTLAAQGAMGATGSTGATGATGSTGATGPAGTGASAFNQITSGTNTAQTLQVGNGSVLQATGSGLINSTEINGVTISGTPHFGALPIATSATTAVWGDPFCQGIQVDGSAASTIMPIMVSGKGGDGNQHTLLTDNTGVVQTHETGTATVHIDATTLAPVAIAGPVQVTDGLNHYQPTGDDAARSIHTTIDNTVSVSLTSSAVNQGTPNTLANAWGVEITDGTNVLGVTAHPIVVSNSSAVTPGSTSAPTTITMIGGQTVGGSPTNYAVPLASDGQSVNVNIHASEITDPAEAATNSTLPAKTLWIGGSDGTKLQGLLVDGSGLLKVTATGGGGGYTGSPAVAAGSVISAVASGYDGANVRPMLVSNTGQQHVIVDSGVASNASVSATGSAVPASATYFGMNIGGNLTGPTGLAVGSQKAMTVAIVDASGNQITTFGSATVTANQGTAAATTAGWSTISGTVARVTSAALTSGNDIHIPCLGYSTALVSLQESGSFSSGNLAFEASDDSQVTWYTVAGIDVTNSRAATDYGTLTVLNNYAPCLVQFPIAGMTNFRVRCVVTPGGATLTVGLQASNAPMLQDPSGISVFGTAPSSPQSHARVVNASIFAGVTALGATSGALNIHADSSQSAGSGVPANADYIGVNVAGNLRGVSGINPAGSVYAIATALVDGSGNQITSFGGGTQFADNAASGATPTGTLSMGWDSGASKVRALKVDASQNLNVNVNAALPAGTNVIGHVINDASSAVIGHVITDSGSVATVTQGTAAAVTAPWYVIPGAPKTSQLSQAVVSFSSSGDNTIVAAVAAQTIRVYRMFIVNGDGTNSSNVTIKDSTPTSYSGAFYLASKGGSWSGDGSGDPLYVTASGRGFVLNSSAAVQMSGTIWYTQSA